jgi:protoheme IX farnesyltransferase
MIGWAAVTGAISFESIVLFLIIFFWTPPHFWALALVKHDDYARAGVPMLPVVAGEAETRRHIVIYSLILVPLGVAPAFLGFAGTFYGVASTLLGAAFLVLAVDVYRLREGAAAIRAAHRMFGYSILYLFLLFALLLAEPWIG